MDAWDIIQTIIDGVTGFFTNILSNMITTFAEVLSDVMGSSYEVLQLPLVQNTISYTQKLAIAILIVKVMSEAIQTYILYQNGDPDSDPGGLLIRTAQAVAVISTLPWIVSEIFMFGTKITNDIAQIGVGATNGEDWIVLLTALSSGAGSMILTVVLIIIAVMVLIVAIQATIRGAELALATVIGPIIALNLSANNRSAWSAWFKEICIICLSQGMQIFMIKGALSLGTVNSTQAYLLIGWLWVTIKTPKFVKQFVYSTGFTGAVGGSAKQAGSMAITKMILKSK